MEIQGTASSVLSQMLGAGQTSQAHEAAVLKLANDQIKQNGENALQLVQAVPKPGPNGNLGHHLDVMA